MYFKLSVRNVKRSVKDYFIYFLTLTFAVCIFYSFNSLSASKAMTTLNASQAEMIQSLTQLLSYVSVFVSVVLGFLILYANNFLIRRRKKELGLYMTLGMSKYKISRIIVIEIFFVGLVSLLAGLLLGLVLSQGLATLTISMFKADITQFKFVFSSDAMLKTILYFGIIFFLVMIFNSAIISRYKLLDLLTASKKNQSLKIRKTSTSVILFVLSILMLGTSYSMMMKYGLFTDGNLVLACVGIGSLGTFLFFMSLSGFVLNMIQKNKNMYFKDVNMFVLRQINSKVNTTYISMTIICLMLFFTIGVFSTGFSYKASMEKSIDQFTPFDASLYLAIKDAKSESINKIVQAVTIDVDQFGDHHSFDLYQSDVNVKTLLTPYQDEKTKLYITNSGDTQLNMMKQSDFKRVQEMQGVDLIKMKDDEVILISKFPLYKEVFERFLNERKTLTMNGKEYKIKDQKVHDFAYKSEFYPNEILTVVVPDEVVTNQKPVLSVVNINYDENQGAHDEKLYQTWEKLSKSDLANGKGFQLSFVTKTKIQDTSVGSSTMIVFIGIYLGIVFLISSAAVLALQQLSEASDNMERYTVLKKIGVTKKSINKAIFWQIFIYFMMPLALAIVHSIFGIQVVNKAIMVASEASVLFPSIITALILIVVYGGYFLATYVGYKAIVK